MNFETIEQWREEYRTLVKCRDALSGSELSRAYHAQRPHFANYIESVIEAYGKERVSMVLGHTVRAKDWDGRFDPGVKLWARNQPPFTQPPGYPPDAEIRTYDNLSCSAHSVILNFVCRHVMETEQTQHRNTPEKQKGRNHCR